MGSPPSPRIRTRPAVSTTTRRFCPAPSKRSSAGTPLSGVCFGPPPGQSHWAGSTCPRAPQCSSRSHPRNRDPRHFPNAERFDIDRQPVDHLVFGHGIHHGLGAALARLEARMVGEAILNRGLHLVPNGDPVRAASPILRGFTSLPVTVAHGAVG